MRSSSPSHTWRALILFGVTLTATLGGITAARKRAASPAPEPTPASQPAPAPGPKPATPTPAPAPVPAAKPAPQQSSAANQLSPDEQLAAVQRRADLVRKRAEWFESQRAYPFKRVPAGALQNAIDQRNSMIVKRAGQRSAAASLITFPENGLWHLIGPQPTNIQSFPGLENYGFPTVSGRVTALAVDTTDTTGNTIYLGGAAGGVWKTTNGGVNSPTNPTWTPLTDSQPSLAVGSIAVDPNNHSTIYVGTGEENFAQDSYYGAGILKSTDGGATWTQLGASLFAGAQSPVGGAKVGAIAVQPGSPNIVLAAVTYFDGGTSGGIYRSANGGTTWTQVSGANAPIGAAGTEVIFEPTSVAGTTAVVYAAMGDPFGDAANGIYKSLDSGQTWTKLAGGLPASNVGRIKLAYAPSTSGAGATLYAAIANSAGSSADLLGFFVTTNGGTTWSQLTATPDFCLGQCFFDMAVAVHPTNPQFVVVGGSAYLDNSTTLFKTSNGGTSWSTDSTTPSTDFTIGSTNVRPHVDTHALAFAPNGATPRLYVGDDGGTWRSDDTAPGNPLWVDLNATLAITQFYHGARPSISDENYGFGGTQDNDIQVFSNSLAWTNAPACGDGGFTAIDSSTPTTIYAGCNGTAATKVMKSVFNGLFTPGPNPPSQPSFNPAETQITASHDTMGFIPPLVIDPNNSRSLYFGTCRIWQTSDSAITWTSATGDLTQANAPAVPAGGCADQDEITAIEVSQQAFGMLFAGTSNGKVWQISFGFPTEIDNGLLPNRNITAVRSKPGDSTGDIGYVTLSGFGACPTCGNTPGHVFKTKNATQGPSATWTDISGNLPDVPVNDIIVDHSDNPTFDAVYIATDVGVFSCPDPEAATPCTNWTVLGDGLPNSPVLSLSMRPESRILHAATHGRGMWDLQLTDEPSTALPLIGSLTPAAVMAGSATINVTVTGVNFGPNTKVALGSGRFASIPAGLNTTFVSTTQLTVSVPSTLMVSGGVQSIGLIDPLGVEGNTLPFTVMNPIPVVTGVTFSPNPGVVAEPVTVTVTGSGFLSGATNLTFNGSNVFGIVSNGGAKFVATVDGSDLTPALAGKSVPVSVLNRLPGGGSAVGSAIPVPNFPISANLTPEIQFSPGFASFNPGQDAGTTSVVLNVKLTNNGGATLTLSASSATINGGNPGDFKLVAPDITQPNPPTPPGTPTCGFITGGAGTSVATGATCFFGITFSPPALAPPGSRGAVLTVTDNDADTEPTLGLGGEVNGPIPEFFLSQPLFNSCFISGCFPTPVNFGAIPKGTPTENDGTLFNGGSGTTPLSVATIGILPSANSADFILGPPSAGNFILACSPLTGGFNLPSGGTGSCSLGLTFTPSQAGVQENATLEFTFSNPGIGKIDVPLTGIGVVPTITSISPEIVQTGGPAFTLNLTGTNYVLGSVVNFNGSSRLTTFVSATQLQASIPASDITTAGSNAITVTNPAAGGTSEPKTLFVAQAESASNDDINFATNAGTTPFRASQDTTQATTQTAASSIAPAKPADPAPACAPGTATQAGKARSVWFLFKAPANGRVIADTRFSSYTTILSAWTLSGALPSSTVTFSPVAGACATSNVPGTTAASLIGFGVTSGTNYYIMVTDASAGGLGGTLTFSLDFQSTAPPNDDNATPTVIAAAPFSGTVNTIQATANTNGHLDPALPGGCATAAASNGQANSVWYTFTAPGTGTITADTLTSPYDTILNVTSGTPTGAQIACNDNAGAGIAQSLVTFAATSGTKYFFMVSAFLGDGGTTNFHLTFSVSPAAIVGVTPNPVSFGNQKQGTTSAASTITVTNSGTLNSTLAAGTPVTITGANSGDFAIASGTTCVAGFVLTASGGSCVIKVTFTPGVAGARTATVNVADDAPASPQQTTLNGTGVLANVAVAPNPVPFGSQSLGTTSAASTITVTNSGTLNSTLTAGTPVTITGANSGDFAIASGTTCVASFVLTASGGSCVIKVTFTPGAAGARTATVNVADDAPASPQQTTLNGTGVVSNVILAPNPVAFGNQKLGTTSTASTITVTNNGTLNATLTAGTPVTITGANSGDFAIATGTTCVASFVLTASGGSCVINVTFTPGAAGARTATVNVADDAPASPQQTTLNGTGVLANVGVAPNPVSFGNQKQGIASSAQTITVTNSGNLASTLSAGTPVTITGANSADFAIATGTTCVASFVLTANGGSCVIKVTFTPAATGARTATVNVADDAPASPQQTTLNGTGVLANVGVAPNPVPFGNQKQGTTSAASTITVTNSGTLNSTLAAGTPVTITGANSGDFAIASGTTCVASFVLTASGGSCVIKVTFTPGAAGARTATVNVADDAPTSPQQTTLNGTGVLANVAVAPNPVPFGNQTLGTTSAASTITVTNSGTLNSTLTAGTPVTITGANSGDFAIASGTTCVASFVLTASGGSCVIKVTFTPGAAGARTATVNVADDAPASPQQTILNGTGVQSTVILSPTPVNFGNQNVATTSTAQTITVTNSGTLAATLAVGTPVTITGANSGDFAITAGTTCVASFVLTASGGSCVINVTFTPAAGGARTATVNVADDAPASPQSANVQGTGVQAAAITSANAATFTVGSLGTFTVTATGSPAPILSESGALPTGVMFTPGTGVLTGTPAAGTGGTYPITFTAHNGIGPDATQNFTLTVNQAAAFTSPNNTAFAVGAAGTFSVVATGFPTPTISESGTLPNVVGFVDNGNGTGKLSGTPAAGTGGTYPITFTAHNGVGADATQSFTLSVDSLPLITTNPITQTVNNGGSVSFTAAASGTPAPTVQWQVSVGGGAFSNLPGATSTTLTFSAAFAQNGNKYQAVFTNSVGTATTTAATLTVVAPDLTVAKSHAGNFTVGQNGTYTIKVTNNGTGPTTGAITVTDTLNANLTFVAAGSGGGSWACAVAGQVVTCTSAGPIAAAANSSFSLVVMVAPGAYPSVPNAASVSDPNDGNSTGADKTSATDTATVNNAAPAESSFSPNVGLIAGATSAQQITITGAEFNGSTTVTFGSNPPLTGTANAAGTSLTISVPASDLTMANAGNVTVTITNPKNPTSNNGGGQTTFSFPLVAVTGAQDASTSGTIMVNAGTPAMVKIDYLTNPVNAPLPAALTVTCALPQSLTGATCTVNGGTIAAGATSGSSTITITAIPTPGAALGSTPSAPGMGGRGPWSTYLLWSVMAALLAMLGMLGAVRQRVLPLRRVPMYLTLGLLMLAAGGLVGCTTAQKTPTPTGPSTLMVTATTADGATVTTTVNINVSN